MAEVFLAEDDPGARVVIKMMRKEMAHDPHFVNMFMREARLAALLQHPNIVSIYDVAMLDNKPCIVMEFLKGRDMWLVLGRLAAKQSALTPIEAATVAAQVATGLEHAHRLKDREGRALDLVHRDISPHNVFLTRQGVAKVVDFGIAKINSRDSVTQTRTGVIKGKLAYMSPEQARGQRDIDHRADQFSLGVMLWEMVTGVRLFARKDVADTMAAMFGKTAKPSSIRAVPSGLEDIIMTTLRKPRMERYQTCSELARNLRGWLMTVGAPSEEEVVTGLLKRVVPLDEDATFYAHESLPLESELSGKTALETPMARGLARNGGSSNLSVEVSAAVDESAATDESSTRAASRRVDDATPPILNPKPKAGPQSVIVQIRPSSPWVKVISLFVGALIGGAGAWYFLLQPTVTPLQEVESTNMEPIWDADEVNSRE